MFSSINIARQETSFRESIQNLPILRYLSVVESFPTSDGMIPLILLSPNSWKQR